MRSKSFTGFSAASIDASDVTLDGVARLLVDHSIDPRRAAMSRTLCASNGCEGRLLEAMGVCGQVGMERRRVVELEPDDRAPLAGGTRWSCIGAPFGRVVEAGVGEDRIAKISAREVSPSQIRGSEINAGHVCAAEGRMP
jgi:hypothetical protein